jgi:large subunit ribosomal protein L21
MYAVIENGSKQYRVTEGDVIEVEKLSVGVGDKLEIERVLMLSDKEVKVGTPTVEGAKVTATVESHGRSKKIIVYKHKKNYHKKQGHRQDFTRLRIDKITAKAEAKAKPKAEAKPKVETKPKAQAKPKTEAKPKAEVKPKAEATKPKSQTKPKAKAEAKPKPKAKAKPKPKPETKAKPKAEESKDGA